MAFWSQTNSTPKRNYKFKISLVGMSTVNQAYPDVIWFAKTVTLPSFDVSNAEVHHFDNRYYFPGRVTWNPVSMTLTDPISPDAAAMTAALLEQMGYHVPTKQDGKISALDRNTFNSKITVKIEVFATHMRDQPVETWELNNAFVESAKWGDLAYDNDDLKQIDITFRYDWAQFENNGAAGANPSGAVAFDSQDTSPVNIQTNALSAQAVTQTLGAGAGQTGTAGATTESFDEVDGGPPTGLPQPGLS